MKTITHTLSAVVAVALLSVSAEAQSPDAGRLIRDIGNVVEQVSGQRLNYTLPYPQPMPCPGLPYPQPQPLPSPEPAPASYFLGVYTSTVVVSGAGGTPEEGPAAYVVPGYEQEVYGQRVNQIVPNSPAFHAGLEPGDILVNANGYALDSQDILRAVIASSEGYMEIQVLDSRSGQLVWVIAETDPQNSQPMVAARSASGRAPQAQTTSQPSVRTQRNTSGRRTMQQRSANESFGGSPIRRPPVRRIAPR
jgi:membrane-associated protease RseP (regulator of RpoE activity)